MDELTVLKQFGVQFPGLALAAVMLIAFLKHLNSVSKLHHDTIANIAKEHRESLAAINRENLEARGLSREVINRNTAVMAENTATTKEQIRVMERFMDTFAEPRK